MSASSEKNIVVAKHFSRAPAGRFLTDGPYSGERFRNEHLIPALREADVVIIDLNGTAGFGSSFLEEAFGGLVRVGAIRAEETNRRLRFVSDDESYIEEILEYLQDAA